MIGMFKHRTGALAALLLLMSVWSFAQDGTDEKKKKETYEDTAIVVEEVVTASRKAEKKLEAPSTIEQVTEDDLLHTSATTFSGALAQVKGIDFANGGINLQKVSTRGFSSSFNSRMLSMVDGKLSTLPGAGLPQGGLSPVSSLDIKSMELVLGPAGALYGSNTSAGVLNIITKDPWDERGLTTAVKAGEQSLINARLRYAGLSEDERWGWKLTGEFLDADEFESDNYFNLAGSNQTSYASDAALQADIAAGTAYHERDLVADYSTESRKYELTGYYKADWAKLAASYSWSENDGFGVTNVGRNRIQGWEIEQYSVKATAKHWYFQYTLTDESAGETYSIQDVPAYLAAGLSLAQAADAAKFINESDLQDIELQGNYTFGNLELIAGANYREYNPSSMGSYLDDFPDANGNTPDIGRDELGLYMQADLRTMEDRLRFVLAGRYDDFSEFDSQFSPKFGVTYSQNGHVFRANYITSYRAPEIIENHLFFLGGLARGNLGGYDVYDANNNLVASYQGLQPEEVTTFELGYRGILGGKVVVDAVAYTSEYENFISPLQVIAHPAFGTYAVSASGEVIPFLLTYLNYGEAEIDGLDIGFDFYFTEKITLKTSYGYIDLKSFDNNTTIPDIPFNTPEGKFKVTLDLRDVGFENSFANLGLRSVDAYDYLSGRWAGRIDSTTILDLAVGYTFPEHDLMLKLSWSNLTDQDKTELLGTPAIPSFFAFEIYKKF